MKRSEMNVRTSDWLCCEVDMSEKSGMSESIPKYWKATLNQKGGAYTRTRMIGVVAMGVAEAVAAIQEEEPEAIIVSITHVGPVNVSAT